MRKTIEATWREGFLKPGALVAPKVNDLYTRKSNHIVDRIQRMQRINEIAIVIGAPVVWAFLWLVGIPYAGPIIGAAWVGLLLVRRVFVPAFHAPDGTLDSYHYLKAFQQWLRKRLAWGRKVQRHLYALTFLAFAIGIVASASGQLMIQVYVDSYPDAGLVNDVPMVVIAAIAVATIVVDLIGGIIFDFDINTGYREVITKLDQMVAEMEELRD